MRIHIICKYLHCLVAVHVFLLGHIIPRTWHYSGACLLACLASDQQLCSSVFLSSQVRLLVPFTRLATKESDFEHKRLPATSPGPARMMKPGKSLGIFTTTLQTLATAPLMQSSLRLLGKWSSTRKKSQATCKCLLNRRGGVALFS